MKDRLKIAIQAHQEGHWQEAEKIYRDILESHPQSADVWHLLGILLAQQQQWEAARTALEKATALDPTNFSYENSLGNIFKNLRDFPRAQQHYEKALQLKPDYAIAHHNLAIIADQQGDISTAIQQYRQALTLQPAYADAHYHLANLLIKQEKVDEAMHHYQQALQQDPHHAQAHHNLGSLLVKKHDFQAAIHHFEQTLTMEPAHVEAISNIASTYLLLNQNEKALQYFLQLLTFQADADTYYHIGTILMQLDRHQEAIAYLQEALKKRPNHMDTLLNLGATYLKKEAYTEAARIYHQAAKLKPEDPEIHYILQALEQKETPAAAPSSYLQHLFDQYAPHFEKHLHYLEYQAPQLVYQSAMQNLPAQPKQLTILDLGCGTGLAGALFHSVAQQLIGIDVSSKMLAIAREKNIYHELTEMTVDDALIKYRDCDLIIAADVFTYIGDLAPIFKAAKEALKPGGLFIFTVEKTEAYPYILQTSARYAHHKNYLNTLAQHYGWTIKQENSVTLRQQKGQPVQGYLYCLVKSAA